MNIISVIFIAFALAMDAFAVSITSGIILKRDTLIKGAFKIGLFFGGFQAIMPVIGWIAGQQFRGYIVKIDHWIAFILLGLIGLKMVYESFEKDNNSNTFDPTSNRVLFILAIATSIDALAAGISFAFLDVPIIKSIILIGIVTFTMSFFGVLLGKNFGKLIKKKAELVGGLVLVSIGIKILIDHTNLIGIFQSIG